MPKKTEPKDTQSTPPEQVQQIRISDIHPFKNHPFKVVDDALMQETVDSIMQFGVLNPTIIRPDPGGGYEMVAGHRRLHASGLAGKDTIPAIVRNLTDDEAVILLVDTNLQRENISPMERAQAYKMKMEALKQTNYVKSIVTAQGKMDLERKSVQSYQGWMYARLLAFSNGDLQALYDRSNGFYRRQLILTTKEKPADRVDDPDIAEKMKLEIEGIFLWAFEGLQRLTANNFRFTESPRTLNNREYVKRDANNAIDFMESTGYIRLKADMSVTSKELYAIYGIWCDENGLTPIRQRSFSDFLMRNLKTYNLEHTNTVINATGRRVWGYLGIEPLINPRISENWGKSLCTYVPES